ncbi:MAG: hypothetical protein ACYCST_12700 [Acidimicrobiales bacterium]
MATRRPRTNSAARLPGAVALAFATTCLAFSGLTSPSAASPRPETSTGRSSSRAVSATSASSGGLELARLGALTNYRSKLTDNATLISTYRVHSTTDWEVFAGKPQPLDVNVRGSEYALIPHVSNLQLTYKWERTGPAQSYDQSPYPSYARGFAALTHVTGVKVVRGKQCRQAGIAGHLWHFAAKAKGAVYPRVSACIANRFGWLLSYDEGPSGGGAPASYTATFTITGVGDVSAIPVPHGS